MYRLTAVKDVNAWEFRRLFVVVFYVFLSMSKHSSYYVFFCSFEPTSSVKCTRIATSVGPTGFRLIQIYEEDKPILSVYHIGPVEISRRYIVFAG